MPELRSPLAASQPGGAFGPVALHAAAPGRLLQLAGWADFETALAPVLQILGLSGAGPYGTARTAGGVHCYRIAPDRILLRAGDGESLDDVAAFAGPAGLAVLDLSQSRWLIGVRGAASADLLARLAAIDFALEEFAVNDFAQTGMHGVSVLVHRRSETAFDLLVPGSWARSVWEHMLHTAAPFAHDPAGSAV